MLATLLVLYSLDSNIFYRRIAFRTLDVKDRNDTTAVLSLQKSAISKFNNNNNNRKNDDNNIKDHHHQHHLDLLHYLYHIQLMYTDNDHDRIVILSNDDIIDACSCTTKNDDGNKVLKIIANVSLRANDLETTTSPSYHSMLTKAVPKHSMIRNSSSNHSNTTIISPPPLSMNNNYYKISSRLLVLDENRIDAGEVIAFRQLAKDARWHPNKNNKSIYNNSTHLKTTATILSPNNNKVLVADDNCMTIRNKNEGITTTQLQNYNNVSLDDNSLQESNMEYNQQHHNKTSTTTDDDDNLNNNKLLSNTTKCPNE